MNTFSNIFILALIASVAVQWFLIHRHVRYVAAHRDKVPAPFDSEIPLDAHRKAADYTQAKSNFGLIDLLFGSVVLLGWTLGGGFELVDSFWRSFGWSELWTGTAFIISVMIIAGIIDIPFSLYRQFVLEEKFGFNKMTMKIFISDTIKNTVLFLVIGTPLLMLVLWIMESMGSLWWLYVFITWFVFSVFMMWAYPAFISPLFNKFRPLEDGELKERIVALLTRNGFKSQGISVMDGSTRSTHGNAYFTGLGSNKRIVFFDTLISELNTDEIEAVLAHELGHFKCNHIVKRMSVMAIVMLAGLAILGWLINEPWFYSGLGVEQGSTYMALTLFMMVSPVFTFFMQPMFSFISRQHEFEADDFAANQAHTENLMQALVKLYRENANTLTPDPLYSAFHDSHPPAPIRIAHLAAHS